MSTEQIMKQCPDCEGMGSIQPEESDDELEARTEEMLNDVYGSIKVCGYEYDAARLLKNVDPIAFRCACSEMEELDSGECETCDGSGEVEE